MQGYVQGNLVIENADRPLNPVYRTCEKQMPCVDLSELFDGPDDRASMDWGKCHREILSRKGRPDGGRENIRKKYISGGSIEIVILLLLRRTDFSMILIPMDIGKYNRFMCRFGLTIYGVPSKCPRHAIQKA